MGQANLLTKPNTVIVTPIIVQSDYYFVQINQPSPITKEET